MYDILNTVALRNATITMMTMLLPMGRGREKNVTKAVGKRRTKEARRG
jgi:hypothetical protein